MDSATLWGEALLRAGAQGAAAIGAIWLLCRLAPRIPPLFQCWLWRLAYLKLLAALLWSTPIPLPLLPPVASVVTELPDGPVVATSVAPFAPAAVAGPTPLQLLEQAALALWAAGCLWCVGRVLAEARQARRLLRGGAIVTDPGLTAEVATLAARLGVARIPTLLSHPRAAGPLLTGLWRPAIVLPETFVDDYDPAQRRMILAHELAHLRRADLWWSWLPRLARCVFFFHPLVWLADHEWQQAQEMACDQEVLRLDRVSASSYGAVLLQAVQMPRASSSPGRAALGVVESYSTVRRRLIAMKRVANLSRRAVVASATLIAACGLIVVVPWRVVAQDAPKFAGALQLSDEVQAKIKQIHEEAIRAIHQTLTPRQLQQLATLHAKTGGRKMALTPEQDAAMKSYHERAQAAWNEIDADSSLTAAQKEERKVKIKMELEKAFQSLLTPDQKAQVSAPRVSDQHGRALEEAKKRFAEKAQAIERDTSLSPQEKAARLDAMKREIEEHLAGLMASGQPSLHTGGPVPLEILATLPDLTPAQKQRIEAIVRATHQKVDGLLTPEQRAQLKQLRDGAH